MRTTFALFAVAGIGGFVAGPAFAEAGRGGAAELDEVVVTAAPYAVSLGSATTSVNIVTADQLATSPAVGLGDALNGLPGLRSTSYGPGASRPVVRGLSGPRVLILQNGVGLVDASALSPDHAVASEPSGASRIEVLRGPSTLAYGGSAIGGVVNILDDRVPSQRAGAAPRGRVSASYGSVDDSYAVSGELTAGGGPWVATAGAARRRSQDYETPVAPVSRRLSAEEGLIRLPDRTVRNSDVDLTTYGAGLSYVGEDGYIGLSVQRTRSDYGLPFAQVVLEAPPEEGPVYIDLRQTRYDLRGEHGVSRGPVERVRFSAGRATYRHSEIAVADGEVGTTFSSRGTEGRVEFVQRQRDGWQGALGAQGLKRDFEANGDEAFVPAVNIEEFGVFTLQRLDLGGWGLEGGLRIDHRRLNAALDDRTTSEAAGFHGIDWGAARASRDFDNVSASAAVFWRPASDWFLSLSLSRNARAPTEFELFADGPHAGTGAYEIGDPMLKAEKATSVEATIRWTGERARLEAHAYTARYDGFIDERPTGQRVGDDGALDPEGELPVFRFTQIDARFRGGEIQASYRIWRGGDRSISLEGAADYVRAATDSGPPARIPPYSLTGRVVWTSARMEARVEVRHVGEQDRVAAYELPTVGYTLVNAKATFRPVADRDLRLFVEGRNLTDEEAREHASFLKDLAPLPGRTVRLGLAYDF